MTDQNFVVGYSTNDFYYTKPDYCAKDSSGKYKQYSTMTSDGKTTTEESLGDSGYTNKITDLCMTNEHYGKQLTDLYGDAQTTSAKYDYSLVMYNRELLRMVNYLAGTAALFAYIYVNNNLLQSS